jgi:hypothetical protein
MGRSLARAHHGVIYLRMSLSPLVVTLRMDARAATHFTALRRSHFPAHRNWLDAHITLFHALPGEHLPNVLGDVLEVATATAPFLMQVERVVFLGRGVAYALGSSDAQTLRRLLAGRWEALLGRQDRARQSPLHITVQNKVAAAVARSLHAQLAADFAPQEILATGIDVWHYEGGPWRLAKGFAFDGTAARPG